MSKVMRPTYPFPPSARRLGLLALARRGWWRLTSWRRGQFHSILASEFALDLDDDGGLVPHVEHKLAIGRPVVNAETGGHGRERAFPAALGRQRGFVRFVPDGNCPYVGEAGRVYDFLYLFDGLGLVRERVLDAGAFSTWAHARRGRMLDAGVLDLHAG